MLINAAHLHLILNHFPIVGVFYAFMLLLFSLIKKHEVVARTGLALLVLSALFAIPTYLSGEEAEEVVEHLPAISEHKIEEHEEAAETAFIAIEILGFLALLDLIFSFRVAEGASIAYRRKLILVFTLAALGLVANAARLGGEIRHPEILKGSM